MICSVSTGQPPMNPYDAPPRHADPACLLSGYGGRIEQLMGRLERLRRHLHDPACPASRVPALRRRMRWLHAAIFAISAELDCSY